MNINLRIKLERRYSGDDWTNYIYLGILWSIMPEVPNFSARRRQHRIMNFIYVRIYLLEKKKLLKLFY